MCFASKILSPIAKVGGLGLLGSVLANKKKKVSAPKAPTLPAQGMSLLEYQQAQNSRGFMDRIF